eukprot:g1228.t1 g1228   contig10:1661771-1662697(+)
MRKHSDAFFSAEDVARFSNHLAAQGLQIFAGTSSKQLSNEKLFSFHPGVVVHHAIRIDTSTPVPVLPTASQLRDSRGEADRREQLRCKETGESYVSLDSLPYVLNADVHEDQSDDMEGSRPLNNAYYNKPIKRANKNNCDVPYNNDDNESSDKHVQENDSDADLSDELIDWSNKEDDSTNDSTVHPVTTGKVKNKTLTTSSQAIGSSMQKSLPDDDEWHKRRSKSDVGLAFARAESLSKFKRRRKTTGCTIRISETSTTATTNTSGGEERMSVIASSTSSRPTLRFMAAPKAVNKRKKQMSLTSMFKK